MRIRSGLGRGQPHQPESSIQQLAFTGPVARNHRIRHVGLITKRVAAEIVSSSADHFVPRHEARSDLTPGELWNRPIQPALWWHPDHTYSSNANNLRLSPEAGGLWREDWNNGSVMHGQVVYAKPERMLRLQAPFGPLQSKGIYTVWTISITPTEDGSIVVFDEVATGSSNTDLVSLAEDANVVKGEAIKRLAGLP